MMLTFIATCLVVMPQRGWAQVLYGSLTGNVSDPSGAAIAGAKVECVNVNTGVSKEAMTDAHGVYLISDLQGGMYSVTVSGPSFATVVQSGIQVDQNAVRRVDVQLTLATRKESITVAASAAVLQTDRTDAHADLSSSQLADLPGSTNRNFEDLFIALPGVTPPTPEHSKASNPQLSLGFYVNGKDFTSNNIRLDGASDVFAWLPDSSGLYIPPVEDLEAVNMVASNFNAEEGVAAASEVNVVTKSGTNEYHGSAWEYNTTSGIGDARNFFYYAGHIAKFVQNQFGGNFGGPIKKNKLFFFAGWEHFVSSQYVSALESVPTAAIRQGNFSGTGTTLYDYTTGNANGTGRSPIANDTITNINSASAKMVALIPLPTPYLASSGIANNYFATGDATYRKDSVDIKVNYNPTEKTTTYVRYSISPSYLFDPQALGAAGGPTMDSGQPGTAPGRVQSAVLAATHTFTPHVLLDGNFGFTRLNYSAKNVDINQNYGLSVLGIPGTNGTNLLQGGIPYFNISGFAALGNSNSSNPFQFRDNVYDQNVNLSWIKGNHSIRFGEEFFHFALGDFQANTDFGVRGGFTFSGGMSALSGGPSPNAYNGFADFLLGEATALGKDYQNINPSVTKENTFAFYGTDQWQVTRKLTANYGVRYEIWPYSYSDYGISGISYNWLTNNVQLGGINGVPSNAGVSTGHGILGPRVGLAYRLTSKTVIRAAYGMNPNAENYRGNVQVYPEVVSTQFSGANSYSAAGNLVTGIPAFAGVNISQGLLPLPTYVGTATYPPNYHRGYVEDYNFTIQTELIKGLVFQAAYVGDRTIRSSNSVNINAALPGTGKGGQPLYAEFLNASSISVSQFFPTNYNGLQLQLSRRFAKGSVVGANYTYSKTLDYADNSESGLSWPLPSMLKHNYGIAGFDRPHNFEGYWTYDLPFGNGQHLLSTGVAAKIAGGWRLTGILTRTSGLPFTVSSSSSSLNAPGSSQTANQVVPSVQILGGHGPNEPYFNPNAFLPVTTATFGNTGKNILFGPGLFDVNAAVFRNFRITERFQLQFRAEAYGLTNTPSFGNPASTVSSASFTSGVLTSYNGYDIISTATGQRTMEFALKLTF